MQFIQSSDGHAKEVFGRWLTEGFVSDIFSITIGVGSVTTVGVGSGVDSGVINALPRIKTNKAVIITKMTPIAPYSILDIESIQW